MLGGENIKIAKRPLRVLHIGNIAQNGYINTKFLRRRGIEADLLIYDYVHAPCYPEWEDAYIENYQDFDEFNPDWQEQRKRLIFSNNFVCPPWVIRILHKRFSGKDLKIPPRQRHLIRRVLASKLLSTKPGDILFLARLLFNYFFARRKLSKEYYRHVSKSDLLPTEALKMENWLDGALKNLAVYLSYSIFGREFKSMFERYDIIQAYQWEPALVRASGVNKPLVVFEHSALRTTPLENSVLGKLVCCAYHAADKIIITNTDVLPTAKLIGLTKYTFVPHPLDIEKFKPGPPVRRDRVLRGQSVDLIFFSPTRHNDEVKATFKLIEAFALFVKKTNKTVKLVLCEWGQEIPATKQLIKDLGIERHVIWHPILPKLIVKEFYNSIDVVFDQFHLGVMGAIAPEAMACGKPVVMHYDDDKNRWAFPEAPPVYKAFDIAEILAAMIDLAGNPGKRAKLGQLGREWVEKNHNVEITTDKLIDAYKEALGADSVKFNL